MIKIKFTSSPNPDLLGEFDFAFDSITLGAKRHCNLIIEELDGVDEIQLQVVEQQLHLSVNKTPYLLNGKKLIGENYVQRGDYISLNDITFEVVDFKLDYLSFEDVLRENYEKIENDDPDKAMVLDALEKELIKLENR